MSPASIELRDTLSRCVAYLHRCVDSRDGREYEARRWVYNLSEHEPQFRWLAYKIETVAFAMLDALDFLEEFGSEILDGSDPSPATISAVESLMVRHELN